MRLHVVCMFVVLFLIVLIAFQHIEGFSAAGVNQATSGMGSTTIYIVVGSIAGILLLIGLFKVLSRHSSSNNNNNS